MRERRMSNLYRSTDDEPQQRRWRGEVGHRLPLEPRSNPAPETSDRRFTMSINAQLRQPDALPRNEHPSLEALRRLAEEARSDLVRSFIRHMIQIHPGHRPPSRPEFDPADVPPLLANIVLVRVTKDPAGFEVTVAGNEVRQAIGRRLMGRTLESICGAAAPETAAPATAGPIRDRLQVVATQVPVYWLGAPRIPFAIDFARVEVCHMPLVGGDGEVSHVLSVIAYEGKGHFADRGR